MHKNLLGLLCQKSHLSYTVFDDTFCVIETNSDFITLQSDIRDFLWEIVGMEESILSLKTTEQNLEIPMINRHESYYDLTIEVFDKSNEKILFIALLQERSSHTQAYADALKEINKKTLIYDTSDAKKEQQNYAQINKYLITFHVDLDGIISSVNDACTHFFNLDKDKIIGEHFSKFFHPKKAELDEDTDIFITKNSLGKTVFFHANIIPIMNTHNKITHNIIIAQDVSYLKRITEVVDFTAQHDTLTGIANRHYLLKQIDKLIKKEETSFYLAYLDIIAFSKINEEYGAHAGDMLLKHLTNLVKNTMEEEDLLVRIHGDTFAILFGSAKSQSYIEELVELLQQNIAESPLVYTPSDNIHFALNTLLLNYPKDFTNSKELLDALEQKMQRKKLTLPR
jgi:diguanylate cyclase (GGDEF)-like protein